MTSSSTKLRNGSCEASVTDLEKLIAECESSSCAAGYEYDEDDRAAGEPYPLTQADCEWIVEHLGRKPTREEWSAAGYHWVGGAHVER